MYIFRDVYHTQKICLIDTPIQRNKNIHKSVTGFPFKPSGLAICHLALNTVPSLLESPLYHRMAGSLQTASHRLSCQLLSSEVLPMGSTIRELKGRKEEKNCADFFSCSWWYLEASARGPGKCGLWGPAQAVLWHSNGRGGAQQHSAKGSG